MKQTIKTNQPKLAVGLLYLLGTIGANSVAFAEEAVVDGFVENATFSRDGRGISKFRNTLQLEYMKTLETSGKWRDISINGVFRATYDAVYDLNEEEFGKDAPDNAYLGEYWHENDNPPVVFVPVSHACEKSDATSQAICGNLKDYMDDRESDMSFPEFNEQADFVRELYLDATYDFDSGDQLGIRLGKQQVIWGRTDLFRVLDVINPVDYSRHNIYDELEDIRIPQWMLQAEYRMGPTGDFDDMNFSLVWNFDKFQPNKLGQCGQPYAILDAGCFFSAYVPAGSLLGNPVDLPVINQVNLPDWELSNTQLGVKWEGVYHDFTFSVNALNYRQQLPSLHQLAPGNPGIFDIYFPRVNLFGGSFDYYSEALDGIWRLETTYTTGEELPRLTNGHKETDILRYVIGMDKNQMISTLNDRRAFLISMQLFGQEILEHEQDMPDFESNVTATFLFKGWWLSDRLSPQILVAHDFQADATVVAPSVDYIYSDNLKLNLVLNVKRGGKATFDTAPAPFGKYEPLSRFTNGPIGVANQEDEFQLTLRYSF